MLRQARSFTSRFIGGPANEILNITVLLITAPRLAAEKLVGKSNSLRRALGYFGATFSASIVFTQVSFVILGIEAFQDWTYWTFHCAVIVLIAIIACVATAPLRAAPPTVFLTAALLNYGASFLLGGFILFSASLTLWAFQQLDYLPVFTIDLASLKNFAPSAMKQYYTCLRNESLLYELFYIGLGGAFDVLKNPLDNLSYVQPITHVAASVLFSVLIFFSVSRRHSLAGTLAISSAFCVYAALAFGLLAYDTHLNQTTDCTERSLEFARQNTAEDGVRTLAAMHAKNVGKREALMTLVGVKAQQRSLILRVRIHERTTSPAGFAEWVGKFRRSLVRDYCTSKSGAYYQRLGISRVWVMQYADTEHVETVVQGPDQCKR